jgi:tetratricopeptide (TPR) repeat protein
MAIQYVVRDKSGSTAPASLEQIRKKIEEGKISASTPISIYPNEFALPAKDYSEFEDLFLDAEKTQLFEYNKKRPNAHEEKTRFMPESGETTSPGAVVQIETDLGQHDDIDPSLRDQATVVIERPAELMQDRTRVKKLPAKKSWLPRKKFMIMMVVALLVYEEYFDEEVDQSKPEVVMVPVRPQLPAGGAEKVNAGKSAEIYQAGIKPYLEDTVEGYRRAVDIFQLALRYDPQNVKALAMLASTYLNLIDSSNKDENTFTVINKLIELSMLKELNLVENLIAQVEFLATSSRYDAAIFKLVEHVKLVGKRDPVIDYYLAWLYAQKGEYSSALGYLNQISANSLPMPRVYYLRAKIHEEYKEYEQASAEYRRALGLNPQHAKSVLGLVRVAEARGELKQVGRYIEFLTSNSSLQSPREYVTALVYRSKLALLYQQPDEAISSLERAIRLDPKNEDLRLEYYSLLSRADKGSKFKSLAQMYALLLEGERYYRSGRYHDATAVYLQAADTFSRSEVPFEKLGDLFYWTGEFLKSEKNYKRALEINPRAAHLAVKLIDAQIRNHDWDDAQQYLARYRTHPALKSSIDRLAGDLAFHQGNYQAAITFYRKSMARDTIDTEVYSAYATALRELDQCKDAQFFYSLARRLDPFNFGAILGGAKCLLKTDGISAAVSRVQEELAKLPKARADFLVGIAELYYFAHDDSKALQFVAQAKELDPEYPETYKIEGQVYLRAMVSKRDLKNKALDAFKAYSDRKPSDPSGYIQRFELLLKESEFQKASEELNRVFEVSPRYPELHYRRARLYIRMGRSKDALHELSEELKINPRFVKSWVEQGNIYLRANNLDLAAQSFTKAMELDPLDADAKLGAANISYLKRQFSSAIALYQSALALDRGNPEIYKRLGFAYRDSGDQSKAAQAFRTYLDLAPDAPDRHEFDKYR